MLQQHYKKRRGFFSTFLTAKFRLKKGLHELIMEILKSTKEFGTLDDDSLKLLASRLEKREVSDKSAVYHEGDPQSFMVFIGPGASFHRYRKGVGLLDEISGPAVAGMLHLFRGDTAFADVFVRGSTECYILSRESLFAVLQQSSGLTTHLLALLAERLRTVSKWARTKAEDANVGVPVVVYDAKEYDKSAFQPVIDGLNQSAASPQASLRFTWLPQRLSAATAPAAIGASVVCIFVNDICDKQVIEMFAKYGVKLIALRCAGYNNVDLTAAAAYKIQVVRVPAYSPYAVAEFAAGLTLMLNRHLHRAVARTQQGNFSLAGLTGFDMYGKTVGIIGTGKIGQCAINIFKGFGCRILAYDAFPVKGLDKELGFTYVSTLEELLPSCDILSIHCPLLPATHHMFNKDRLALVKKGALIINTSRGPIIETEALVAALKSGHVGGAGLDVYENEREYFFEDRSSSILNDDMLSILTSMPNVVITGHQAFLTQEALQQIASVTCESIADVFWRKVTPKNEVKQEYTQGKL